MGKHGPCYHCGVTSTPLWRNGPPDKPVLCNACGSRWRTKGTLANYTPLHARSDPVDFEDHRVSKMKSASLYQNKEVNMLKRKLQHENGLLAGGIIPNDHSQNFHKTVDEDTSNRSSSGSAISNSESCAQFGSADASDLTGPAQSMVWDTMVPSRKRTCVNRSKPSSVEKLTKDLYTILQEQQSSYFSGSSEEDLLLESEAPMVSVEIGHGSVLIRHPSSIAREEESEASSLSIDNSRLYPINESYSSYSATFPVHSGVEIQSGKMKNLAGHGVQQEQCKRDKSQYEKAQVLGNHNSPLCNIDLTDVLNLEEFTRQLTDEEQKQLMKYLPQIDAVQLPDNLKCMFESLQFKENLTSFQQLLAEGVLDLSSPSAKFEDCKTLKRLALCNLSKSKWVERYHILKESKNSGGAAPVMGPTSVMSSNFMNAKRFFHDTQNKNFSDAKTMMKSPKRVMMKSPKRVMMKGSLENKELIDYESYCFSPRSLFALPSDRSSLPLESLQFVGESSDQDLLLDVRSNNSFPQAELLHPASTGSSSGYPNLVHNRFC